MIRLGCKREGGKGNLQSTKANEHSREPEAGSKRREEHCRSKCRMTTHPYSQKIWFILVELLYNILNALRRSMGKAFIVWRFDNKRQYPRPEKRNDRINDEGLASYTANLSKSVARILRVSWNIVAKIRLSNLFTHRVSLYPKLTSVV